MAPVFWFLVYAILGWVLDSGYRSMTERRWTMGNALRPLPVCPVYGFGAWLALGAAAAFSPFPWWIQWGLYGGCLAFFEWASGVISAKLFRKRLWSYGNEDGWVEGYTDAWHVPVWGGLAMVTVHGIHPWLVQLLAA
jgi:uncharacterized membrane protein